jgi:hypothetical protein
MQNEKGLRRLRSAFCTLPSALAFNLAAEAAADHCHRHRAGVAADGRHHHRRAGDAVAADGA